jgi:hypothetical protein
LLKTCLIKSRKIPKKNLYFGRAHTRTKIKRESDRDRDRETERSADWKDRLCTRGYTKQQWQKTVDLSFRSLAHWQPSNVIQCYCKSRSATMFAEEADADLDNESSFERPQEFPTVPPNLDQFPSIK